MADDGSKQSTNWPLPKFYFQVDIGDQKAIPFQEVSGLDVEAQIIEYRAGNNRAFSPIKMLGIQKFGNITLKKGIFVNDNNFWTWYKQSQLNTPKRQTITIRLIDEGGNPTMVWTLANAWPTKITSTDLKSDGNEVAIETLEIAHEGLTVANS